MSGQLRQTPIKYSNNAATIRGMMPLAFLCLLLIAATCNAFVVTVVPSVLHHQHQYYQKTSQSHCLLYAAVGIFFGTSVRVHNVFLYGLFVRAETHPLLIFHHCKFGWNVKRLEIPKTVPISCTKRW